MYFSTVQISRKNDDSEEYIKEHDNCTLCLLHEFFEKDDDVFKKCTFEGYNKCVKPYVAVPLNREELKKMKLESLITLKFDSSKPMGILEGFANTMLSREKSKEWSEKSTTFSDTYLHLWKPFQEET